MSEPRKRNLLPLLPTEGDLRHFEWPLEKKAYGLLCVLLPMCPFWWLIDKREPDYSHASWEQKKEWEHEWNQRRANWVLGWMIVLIVLWLVSPDSEAWKLIVGVVAGLRLLEVFVTGLGTILDQSQQIRARNVLTILAYAVQVTLIFAILYHSFAETGFNPNPHRPSDFLYISWSAMVSLGNPEFEAKSSAAKFLEVATTTAAIFLLTVLFAYAIDTVKTGKKRNEDPETELGESSVDAGKSPAGALLSLSLQRNGGSRRLKMRLHRSRRK